MAESITPHTMTAVDDITLNHILVIFNPVRDIILQYQLEHEVTLESARLPSLVKIDGHIFGRNPLLIFTVRSLAPLSEATDADDIV